jgi:hypothetical protein
MFDNIFDNVPSHVNKTNLYILHKGHHVGPRPHSYTGEEEQGAQRETLRQEEGVMGVGHEGEGPKTGGKFQRETPSKGNHTPTQKIKIK